MNCILALQKCRLDKYSIHGIWFDSNQKQSCSFISDTLPEELRMKLEEVWYSCGRSNEWFWKHEYCKHGKGYFQSAEEYFKVALEAYEFVDYSRFTRTEVKIPLIYTKGEGFQYRLLNL
jgi:ribonuclease I